MIPQTKIGSTSRFSSTVARTRKAITGLPRKGLHPFFRDIGMTTVTQFAVLLTSLALVSLLGKLMGPIALGEYLLVRRVAGGLQPSAQLGLGVALPRYVARSTITSSTECETYFLAALICLLTAATGLGLTFYVKSQLFAQWLFGSFQRGPLVIALSLLLLGWAVQVAVYGYYRGRLQMGYANLLQLVAMALVPLVVVTSLFRTHSIAFLIGAIGVSVLLCSALLAIPIVTRAMSAGLTKFVSHTAELLRYGIVRVPGALAVSAFFALGPIIAAHYVPMTKVSYFLIGLSILSAVGYCGAPLGVVILSKATMMIAQKRHGEIRKNLSYLVAAVTELSLFVCVQLLIFADVVIHIWVGHRFLEGVPIIRILMVGIPFYLFIIALRSVVDAASWKPYNTRNIAVALALFLALVVTATQITSDMHLLQGLAGALVISLALLAFLTGRTVERLYAFRFHWRKSASPMLFSLGLGGVALLFRSLWGPKIGIVQIISIELCLALLFVGALVKQDSPWLIHLWKTALPNRSPMKA